MLHLLFTGQDVHDLKLHVTEQKKCSLRAEVHWLALVGRSDRWLTESAVVRLGGIEVGAKAPTNEVAVVRCAYHSHSMSPMPAYLLRELLSPTFSQNMNQKELAFVF